MVVKSPMHIDPSCRMLDNNQALDYVEAEYEEDVVEEDVENDVGMDVEKCARLCLNVHF